MHFSALDPQFTLEFFNLTDQAQSIAITGHKSPDEDSIASTLSVYNLLKDKYPEKKITPACPGKPELRFKPFKNFQDIQFVPEMTDIIKDIDLLIMVDGSQFGRFSENPDLLKSLSKKTICIDHHSSPIDSFDLSLVIPTFSSNSELIYRTLFEETHIDKETAEVFLLGILGDTGNFTYLKPYQTDTLLTAKTLMNIAQVEIQEFQSRYRSISKQAFAIIQELIKNTQYKEIKGWPAFQISYLSKDFFITNKLEDNEVSESSHIYTSHYLRIITGYPWGFIITPRSNGQFNISLRSLPKCVSVRIMMEDMGKGGGHDRAAGGTFKDKASSEECITEIIAWTKDHQPVIN